MVQFIHGADAAVLFPFTFALANYFAKVYIGRLGADLNVDFLLHEDVVGDLIVSASLVPHLLQVVSGKECHPTRTLGLRITPLIDEPTVARQREMHFEQRSPVARPLAI